MVIKVLVSPNEVPSDRYKQLFSVIQRDNRFSIESCSTIPVDIRFESNGIIFDVELKEPQDYVSSIFNGHLYEQILSLRENGNRSAIVVLGGDEDIATSVLSAIRGHVAPKKRHEMISNYTARIRDFEANCFAIGVPVMRWKRSPWERILSTAHKVLTGGSLLPYLPKSPDGERLIAATCMAIPGIGPIRAKAVLEKFRWELRPMEEGIELEDCKGIGQKMAEQIRKSLNLK